MIEPSQRKQLLKLDTALMVTRKSQKRRWRQTQKCILVEEQCDETHDHLQLFYMVDKDSPENNRGQVEQDADLHHENQQLQSKSYWILPQMI